MVTVVVQARADDQRDSRPWESGQFQKPHSIHLDDRLPHGRIHSARRVTMSWHVTLESSKRRLSLAVKLCLTAQSELQIAADCYLDVRLGVADLSNV